MSGHKHSTDRVDGFIVAECPEGCDISVEVEYEAAEKNEVLADLKRVISTCHNCGTDMAYMQQEEPTEVLN